MSWKILRRTTLDRFEAHKDFLQLTYDALVALAQKGYATKGRGWLVIPEDDVLENLSRRPSVGPNPTLVSPAANSSALSGPTGRNMR